MPRVAQGPHLELDGDLPQLLDGAGPADVAPADEGDGFAPPLHERVVHRVRQPRRVAVFVRGSQDHEPVRLVKLAAKARDVAVGVVTQGARRRFLVEERQRVVPQVHKLDFEGAVCGEVLQHPRRDPLPEPARSGAPHDDLDPCQHVSLFWCSRWSAVYMARGVGGGGRGWATSTAQACSRKATSRGEGAAAALPVALMTPALAISIMTRSSAAKSGRSLPTALARATSWAKARKARSRSASKQGSLGKIRVSTSVKPRSYACMAQTFWTYPQKPSQGSGSAAATSMALV